MWTFINLIILIVLVVWIYRLYATPFIKYRTIAVDWEQNQRYLLNKDMYFLMFTICTATLFLSPFSLLKYGIWLLVALYVIMEKGRLYIRVDSIVACYLLFYGWLIIKFITTAAYSDGAALLIKYSIPLLFLWVGYKAFDGIYSLYFFNDKILKIVVLLICLIGGISETLYPFVYYGLSSAFLTYAGFSDYLTSLFIVPLVLFWITKKKIYLMGAAIFFLSVVLESVRTAIGGMFLSVCFAFFFKYKIKSLPYLFVGIMAFLSVILFVPSVNEKMFGEEKAGAVTMNDVVENDALSMDNIQTSGRSYFWDLTLKKFYEPNRLKGSGLGSVTAFTKSKSVIKFVFLLHSDYVQILCDSGLIGLWLLILFYVSVILKVFKKLIMEKTSQITMYTGIMAVSSLAGVAFSMGFDNVVSHSMTSLINPFIFLGFFIKSVDLSNKIK